MNESLVKIAADAFGKASCVDGKKPKDIADGSAFEIPEAIHPVVTGCEVSHK